MVSSGSELDPTSGPIFVEDNKLLLRPESSPVKIRRTILSLHLHLSCTSSESSPFALSYYQGQYSCIQAKALPLSLFVILLMVGHKEWQSFGPLGDRQKRWGNVNCTLQYFVYLDSVSG